MTFQEIIFKLKQYWAERGCIIQEPYDTEVGAGTMCPETFLRVSDPNPIASHMSNPAAAPPMAVTATTPTASINTRSCRSFSSPPGRRHRSLPRQSRSHRHRSASHDFKLEEDNWEAPTLGAWGIGWQAMLDGLEISQFTYFQQCGGIDLDLVPAELTYGLERITAFLQVKNSVYDIAWTPDFTYGDVRHADELQYSVFNFEMADIPTLWKLFELYEAEAGRLLKLYDAISADKKRFPLLPTYDQVLKCSNLFNTLDARGAISVTERVGIIARAKASRGSRAKPGSTTAAPVEAAQ